MDIKSDHTENYINEASLIIESLDLGGIRRAIEEIKRVKASNGRLFTLGIGGSASTASHATADFRKMCDLESYHVAENLAEISARINDSGWDTCLSESLAASKPRAGDAVMIFSVGGGSREYNLSIPLIRAAELAKECGARVIVIAGRDGGETARIADASIIIPPLFDHGVTCHTEGTALVILHLLVSEPRLISGSFTWEGKSLCELRCAVPHS